VPSGRLVVSWPHSVGQIPDYYDALDTGRPAGNTDLTHPPKDSVEKYLSRYIDEPNAPEFPFGYGLSYTEFRYSAPQLGETKLSAEKLTENLQSRPADKKPVMTVTVNVTNSGNVSAEEVVQLYVGLRGTSVEEPVRALKAFERVALTPGETKKVTFPLTAEAFALWDILNDYKVEPSRARIWVSHDSQSGQPVELEISE
jgi:beta-glucosidase